MILTGQTEGMRNREKQRISYMTSMSKWIADQNLGDITKRLIYLAGKKCRES